ncbi:MAG: diphthamide biosynthesis enzyme Dph2 [Candidatus Methanospirareceae archaeon]
MDYDFEIERVIEEIRRRGARKIGLQLPEGLKIYATTLAEEISKYTNAEVIISGNSCYGACDIDEKLREIVDLLFHFGHTPLPHLEEEKVIFIELRSSVDVKKVIRKAVKEIKGDEVGLVTTVQHIHTLGEVKRLLASYGKKAVIGKSFLKYDGQVLGCEYSSAKLPCDEILFIGSGSFHPIGIALYVGKKVIAADPFTMHIQVHEPEEVRKRRYKVIERALDAKSFGIIVGMKSGQFNMEKAIYLKEEAMKKGLKAFIIAMDEINEEKLLAYRVDAFIKTACPRVVEDLASFDKPVLTMDEFEVVIGNKSWEDLGYVF